MTATELAILVTLLVYKIALIAIGILCRRRTHDASDYYLGGRKLGPVVAAVSASASSSSAWTLVGVSGFAYSQGLAALWLFPACVGGFCLNWMLVAPALRRWTGARDAITMADLLVAGSRGPGLAAVRALAAAIVLIFFTLYVAAQFRAAGDAFENAFAMNARTAVLLGAAIVVFYTLLGGFWAVSVTDTLQGALMASVAVLLPAAAFWAVGPTELVAGLRAVDSATFLDPFAGQSGAIAIGFVLGLLGIGIGYPGQPHVVNRFLALRGGERELARARLVAIGWSVIIYAGMILLGLCARVLLGGGVEADDVFMSTAATLLHPLIAGIVMAAFLSAIMSTADSQLLAAASAVTHDLRFGGGAPARMLRTSRATVLVLSAVATALAMPAGGTIFDRVLFAWSAMGAAFGPLLLRILIVGPIGGTRAFAAMSTGLLLVCAQQWGPWELEPAGFFERVVPFVAAGAIVLAPPWRSRTG